MDQIEIIGQRPLCGKVDISGAKNAALPIMASSLLLEGTLEISNIPNLVDINTMGSLLINHGAVFENNRQGDILINCSQVNNLTAPYDIVSKMRASIWVLGPLLSRFGYAKVSLPGGCAIGARMVDQHIDALNSMGANIEIDQGYIVAKASGSKLKATDFTFVKNSVGATINAILAATLAEGTTVLHNCAKEPEIVDLCGCLQVLGAKIEGVGTSTIEISGQTSLSSGSYKIIPDRIEAGTYMIAAAITKGNVEIHNVDQGALNHLSDKLIQAGVSVDWRDDKVVVSSDGNINAVDITTGPFPDFATDLQAQFMSLMTLANGRSLICETIFENRFMHAPELCRMNATIHLDSHTAIVDGVNELKGAEVMASDLRASASLVLAALAAKGKSTIKRVYHLDRGYETIEKKLQALGAEIKRVKSIG